MESQQQRPLADNTPALHEARQTAASSSAGQTAGRAALSNATLISYFDPYSYNMLREFVDKDVIMDGYRVWQKKGGKDKEFSMLDRVKEAARAEGILLNEFDSEWFTEVLHTALNEIEENFLMDEECRLLQLCQQAAQDEGLDGYVEVHRWLGDNYHMRSGPVTKKEYMQSAERQFKGNQYAAAIASAL